MGSTVPIGVLVMAYGTADGPEDIERYYTDIRGGRAPSAEHLQELRDRYAAIGNRFPLLDITRAQARGIVAALDEHEPGRFRAYVGMKHSPPWIADAVRAMRADGIERAIGIVMAPHWSGMSIPTYEERVEAAVEGGVPAFTFVQRYSDHPAFIALLADRVRAALATLPADRRDATVLFTAHSLPVRREPDGTSRCLRCADPSCAAACRYAAGLQETADLVAAAAGLDRTGVAWQSAGRTADPWWGPPVEDVIRGLGASGEPAMVVCSAGFVADHLEILYDLDIEARSIAEDAGMAFARTEMPNADPAFLTMLADVVAAQLDPDRSGMTGRIVVVGAGVTGLAAAHRLRSASPGRDVLVLEREERPGGKVGAVTVGGLELEAGPDSFLARKPWAVDLCGDLGLGDDLVPAAVGSTQLWTEHGLVPFPPGPLGIPPSLGELWRAAALPSSAKLRASLDLVIPRRRSTADESLRSLLRRRLGRRAAAELVEPLLGGVLAADPGQVSAAATFPELVAWEHDRRSLIRGARATAAGRRPVAVGDSAAEAGGGALATFLTVRGGLHRMIDALVAALGPDVLRTGTPVVDIRGGEASRFVLRADGSELDADAVIMTTPAVMSAGLLTAIAPEAAAELGTLGSTSTAVAVLVYPDGTDARLPASSGFVATPGSLPITAATLVSRKWPDPAFGSRAVVRAFVADGALLRADDEELIGTVGAALADVYPLPAMPFASAVVRWPDAMPRYDVGHLERVASIEAALPPGVVVAGSAFHGVGVPDCIRQGTEAAERVTAILAHA